MEIDRIREREAIDSLRRACGTLPSRTTMLKTDFWFGCEKLSVQLIDEPKNPYKAIFTMATATWGNDQYENKWDRVGTYERYLVVLSALQGKTLPTALEAPKYTFVVKGLPRHCFDQMARTRIGAAFGSVGCRDNSKIDSSMVLYSEYLKKPELLSGLKITILRCKAMYLKIIEEGQGSYQLARSILPMSYHHPFVFTQNLMSLISQSRRRLCFGEEEFICGLHWDIRDLFDCLGYKLIADNMRPACDYAQKCLYSKSDGSELFGNLFSGCGRWPRDIEYSEFNQSCTDRDTLEQQIGFKIPYPSSYINFTLDREGFRKLGEFDKTLLSE